MPGHHPARQALLFVYINVATVCFLLVGCELAGQLAYYWVKGRPVWESHRPRGSDPVGLQIANDHPTHRALFRLHPYLVGQLRAGARVTHRGSEITILPDHTRWTGAPESAEGRVRVQVLGGSTTFGTGVTDRDTWPAQLQARLGDGYHVVNHGVPGYSTAEAIIQMGLCVPEAEPDIVVFYQGWNDIRNYHDPEPSSDYRSHGIMQYTNLQVPIQLEEHTPIFAKLERVSVLFRINWILASRVAAWRRPVLELPSSVEPDPFVDRVYARNLDTLETLTRGLGAHTVFVPQVLYDHAFEWREVSRPWTPRIRDDALPGLLARFNAIMSRVCDPGVTDCSVVEEIPQQDWRRPHFVDSGHLSREGGALFSEIVARHIRSLGVVDRQARGVRS